MFMFSGSVFSPLEASNVTLFRSTATTSSSTLLARTMAPPLTPPLFPTVTQPNAKPQVTKPISTLANLTEQSFPTDSTLINAPLASSALLGSTIPSQLHQPQVQSTPSSTTPALQPVSITIIIIIIIIISVLFYYL